MARLTAEIRISNAATVTDDGEPDLDALAEMLIDAAENLRGGVPTTTFIDANGNTVGSLHIER